MLYVKTGCYKMTENELRWAHMEPSELVRELTIRSDLTPLETILVNKLDEVLEDQENGFGEPD